MTIPRLRSPSSPGTICHWTADGMQSSSSAPVVLTRAPSSRNRNVVAIPENECITPPPRNDRKTVIGRHLLTEHEEWLVSRNTPLVVPLGILAY